MRRVTSCLLAVLAVLAGGVSAQAEPRSNEHTPLSAGCRQPAPPGQSYTGTVTSGGVERTFLVRLPENHRPTRPHAVVLAFHGHGRTSEYQRELSDFSRPDVIAVYPQGLTGTDGKSAWQGAPYSAAVDDVQFTGDLIDELQRTLCVNPSRIHAAGKSNGGGFTGLLACRMGDRIAAFAAVSGAFYPQAGECAPRRPVPVLAIHGTADTTIPYDGDAERGLPALPDWLAAWSARNGCDTEPRAHDLGDGVWRSRWHSCAGRGAVTHYRIDGLGHDWPSTRPNPDSEVPSVMDATPVIERFFAAHPLHPSSGG
ncbi:polyhydroxybutyrate depolymerase [Herbihabitans rhizosphaerae]|uniref:Polyhydroxybutyrate depolymerase n=1 Tax=Herbihabitans rhizosphaerae TaxID=1872711 RepID=A0A4Q7KF58_9PSEU|nr:ferulic acid esterase [Herbihabitans rhizosphaerae]RZS32502.1 polyhydroxybutyrate depolymerase [Herbihabitans rhizosphaerae]